MRCVCVHIRSSSACTSTSDWRFFNLIRIAEPEDHFVVFRIPSL
jgi:hypothetical protein